LLTRSVSKKQGSGILHCEGEQGSLSNVMCVQELRAEARFLKEAREDRCAYQSTRPGAARYAF
jgi:hypothetical protein